MTYVRIGLIALVALLHVYIAWFEIFAWTTRGPEVFSGFPIDFFEPTIPMAANPGRLQRVSCGRADLVFGDPGRRLE